jgi:hypothetical protein
MVKVWDVRGYEKKDPDKSTKAWDYACDADAEEVVKRFKKLHGGVEVTGVSLRGSYEVLS